MKNFKFTSALAILTAAITFAASGASPKKLDTTQIDELTGLKGKLNEAEGVYKVSSPRTDVKVSIDKWHMPPFMGLTSWASFMQGKQGGAMVMGDLVLMEDEVNSVMSAAFAHGLNVTALHNHFFFDEPKVYFMHIGGEGETAQLAKGVRAALDKAKEIRSASQQPTRTLNLADLPVPSSVSAEPLQKILGIKGEAKDGMFKAVFGRAVKMPCGCEVGKEMGVNTWAAFAGSDENAVVDGDFVVLGTELQPALKSLRQSGINIVAIHHHMVGEEPRMIFFHYWGRGSAANLAIAVKTALKLTTTKL